ncbi:MAG: hypothetical protein WCS77_01265 [Elusimicrobiaceae bacterium]
MPEQRSNFNFWLVLVYLSPLYVLAMWPIMVWINKVNSPDVAISEQQSRSFSTDREMAKPERIMPQLPPNRYGVEDPNSDSDRMLSQYDPILDEMNFSGETEVAAPKGKGKPKPKSSKAWNRPTQEAGPLEQKASPNHIAKMNKVGNKSGVLTNIVGNALTSKIGKSIVTSVFNNKFVVEAFVNRSTVKGQLENPQKMVDFLKGSSQVSTFFNDKVVKSVLDNPELLNAVLGSQMADTIINSPAGQALINNPAMLQQVVQARPELVPILMNPNVVNALTSNDQTAGVASVLQSVGGK